MCQIRVHATYPCGHKSNRWPILYMYHRESTNENPNINAPSRLQDPKGSRLNPIYYFQTLGKDPGQSLGYCHTQYHYITEAYEKCPWCIWVSFFYLFMKREGEGERGKGKESVPSGFLANF
jgi:hypothetical protein